MGKICSDGSVACTAVRDPVYSENVYYKQKHRRYAWTNRAEVIYHCGHEKLFTVVKAL